MYSLRKKFALICVILTTVMLFINYLRIVGEHECTISASLVRKVCNISMVDSNNADNDIKDLHRSVMSKDVSYKPVGLLQAHPHDVMPRIAHFTLAGCSLKFQFFHLICLVSVYRVVKPTRMMFHTDCEPTNNEFWDEVKQIPILEVVRWPTLHSIFNHTIENNWHRSDVLRILALRKYGGFYTDLDFWFIKPVDPLFHYDFVVERCGGDKICSGILFTRNDSLLLNLYYENYKHYDPSCFLCSNTEALAKLILKHPHAAHIEHQTLKEDNWEEQYLQPMNWTKQRYSIMYFFREKRRYGYPIVNRENIKYMNNTVGEIARYIYYGVTEPALETDQLKPWYHQLQDIKSQPFQMKLHNTCEVYSHNKESVDN